MIGCGYTPLFSGGALVVCCRINSLKMFNIVNGSVLAAVLVGFSCAMGFPMLLGEPDLQEDADEMLSAKPVSSDGSFEQQMQQTLGQQIPPSGAMLSEEPMNVEMAQDGIQFPFIQQPSAPHQVQPEQSSPLQPQQPQITEKSDEPTQTAQPDAMQSDQPIVIQPDQSQLMSVQPQETPMQPTLCPPASDCPEADQETHSTNDQSSATAQTPQIKPIVVMTSDDNEGDKFQLTKAA